MANQLSTLIRLASQRGILAAFKYVKLIDQKYIVEKTIKEQVIKRVAMYERKLEVDPITGEVTKDELELPTHAEDFTFEPPMQRQNNDPFTCQDINDTTTEPAMAHVIKIGIHALTAGFGQVNTNDNQSCVKDTLEDTIM
jgi:hypothetical protein